MDSIEQRPVRWWETVLYVVSWLGSTALLLLDVLFARAALQEFMEWWAFRQVTVERLQGLVVGRSDYGWTIGAIDRGMLLVLACAGVALSVFFEYYYRAGMRQGLFYRRVLKVTAIQAGVLLVSLALQFIF